MKKKFSFKQFWQTIIKQLIRYGFEYEIKEQQLILKPHTVNDNKDRVEIVKDNRNLLDKNDNQKLTKEDIDQMRKDDDLTGNVNF